MTDLRILCTADLHLGRASSTTSGLDGFDFSACAAWARIVDLAVRDQADAVVISGDLFDGSGSYLEAREPFLKGLRTLQHVGVPVIAVAGNHDWEVLPKLERERHPNLHILGLRGEWETRQFNLKSGPVAFTGWSFPAESVRDSHLADLKLERFDHPVVGLVHGDLAPNSPYHPIKAADFEFGADAWVLGHIHLPSQLGPRAIYPGSPQSLDFGPGERGVHGVRWLGFDDGRAKFSRTVPISNVRFEFLELRIPAENDQLGWQAALDEIEKRGRSWRIDHQGLESWQVRADVALVGCPAFPATEIHGMPVTIGPDSLSLVQFRAVPSVDPWTLVDSRTALGEAARLAIAVRAMTEVQEDDERIPEEWLSRGRDLVEAGAVDLEGAYRKTLGKVSDDGDSAWSDPSWAEFEGTARTMILDELDSLLLRVAS